MIDLKTAFIQPDWPVVPRIKAYTSLRESGVGKPGEVDKALLKQLLQLPYEPELPKQIHGTTVVSAGKLINEKCEADAVYTNLPNQICVIQTADCVPVLVANRSGTHVAAIHAGWRGLAKGVIEATLTKLNLASQELLVWLGPAIGPTKFLVREDVYNTFTKANADAKQAFQKISPEQWLADLYQLTRQRLQQQGIDQIFGGEYCTYSDEERFFSYRRDGKITGRMATVIWIAGSDKMFQ